jgi:hypothetical protein
MIKYSTLTGEGGRENRNFTKKQRKAHDSKRGLKAGNPQNHGFLIFYSYSLIFDFSRRFIAAAPAEQKIMHRPQRVAP